MSERAKAVPRSASWGAACAPCARAKARCIRSNKAAGDRCDRCENLQKSCVEQAPKTRKKRQAKLSRSQQLEAKLDNLLESLKRPEQNPNLGHLGMQLRDSPEGSKAHSSSIFTGGQPGKIQTSDTGSIEIAPLPGYNTYARPLCTCSETIEQEDLVPSQPDEVLLSIYRSQLSAQFPFVIIPPRVTLAELRETRPFLLKVVRMIASIRNRRSMWGQSHAVMRHLTEAAMIRGERSLDLLQGILMFVGYFHYYCMAHGQFSNLIHLAVSMITDTGLDRHSKPREKNQFVAMDREEPRKLTSEEKRVVLGVWYMNSNAALTWNIINSTCFTKHLQQCRQELEEAPEYETDRLLVELVKIQHLTEKIFRFNHREELVDTMPGFTSPSEEDALLYTSSLEAEMEGMRRSLPASLEHNYLLSSHYSITHIRLYENLLANSHPWEERMTQSLSPASDSTQSEHNIHYAAATQAVQEWLHTWLSIPVCYYFYMPQPGISHLIFAATMLVRRARLVLLAWGQPAQRSATGSAAGTAPSDRPVPKAVPATVGYTPFQGFLIEPLITLAGRFESAKQEIGVAHATEWKNDFFDIAGMILRNRADRIEKWCGVVNAKGFLPRKHTASDSLESPNAFRTVDDMLFEQGNAPLFNDADLENWLWAGDFFDGMGLNPGPMDGFGGSDPVAGISMGIAVDPSVVYR